MKKLMVGTRVYRVLAILFLLVAFLQGRYNYAQIESLLHPGETPWLPLAHSAGEIKAVSAEAKDAASGLATS